MNIEEVRTIIRDRFGEVGQPIDGVLKASSSLGDSPISLWLFDCTQSFTSADFDLSAYQDKLLRDEFYSVTGSLQWNLYCYFLCDEGLLAGLEASGTVGNIERDTTYARKFVRTPAMLRIDFTSLSSIKKPVDSNLPEDIAALWQRKLADNGLAVICSGLSYAETVRRIKSGEPFDEADSDINMSVEQSELSIDAIDAIDLGCFRQRPKKRQFEFAQCNLIYGVNGAGKTSLLEGIEAWICGKHRRNDTPVPANCLKIKLNGSAEWQNGPVADVSLYRQRDSAWYGNYQARKNYLHVNFSRFNFFDADAAARLEISNDDRDIENALSHLVLGETATKIAEYINKVLPLLQKEERAVSRMVKNAKEVIKSAQEAITSLQVPTDTRMRTYEKLTEQLRSAGWRKAPPQDSSDECLVLLTSLNKIKARIDSVLADLPWLVSPSIANVEKERQALTVCTAGIQTVLQETATLKKQQEESTRNADVFAKWAALLQRCLAYVQVGATTLLNSAEERTRLKKRKKSLMTAAEAIANIDLTQFEGVTETGGDMAGRLGRDLDQHSKNSAKVRQTVVSLESFHGRIETLLAEIRVKTQELLTTAPATAICPVCGATYGEGELQIRLQHQAMHVATPELQQAHSELTKLQKQQERLSRVLRDLDALISIGRDAMGMSTPAAEPVSKLVASVMFLERGIAQCDIDISKLEHDRGQMEAKGFNVEELLYLNRELLCLSQDLSLDNEAQLCRKLEEMASKQKEAMKQADEYAKALAEIEAKTQMALAHYAPAGDATLETVMTRMVKVNGAIERLGEIVDALSIDAGRPFTDVAVDIDSLKQAVEGFVRLKQQEESVVQVIAENEKKIAASKDTLGHEEQVWERLKSAVEALEKIQLEHSAEKYLEDFFSQNLHQIRDLFCAMHAPRDFCDVVWQPDDPMAIRVVRKSTNAACSVAELSSGQRNALALAIFLTMNRKITQAPSLILMDDPVAYVDDLNIISFLDCLREMLSGCNRQLFFATASAKTAHLFTRKFDYLGDEAFRSFRLTP